MESTEPLVVGLDIGTTKIAAIVGRRNEYGKIEILGIGKAESLGVRRGIVMNITDTIASIKEAVKKAEDESGITIKCASVGIAGQHIRSDQQTARRIRPKADEPITEDELVQISGDMFKLVMNPGEEVIDVIPQDYTIDGESGVIQPVGMLGSSLEANYHVITGQILAAQNIYRCVKLAGLEVSDLVLEPLASSSAVLSEEEKEAGVCLVDIGGGTTDIAIFKDGIIRHTHVIPFGGEVLTEDIKEGCSILKKHAEELKIKFGSALASENSDDEIVAIPGLRGRPPKEISLRNLASIIQARMQEIIEQVYNEIKISGLERKIGAGIVLTGGGALLKHLVQLTEFMTGMDTRIGYPNEHLANQKNDIVTSPVYSTGIGLVIERIGKIDKLIKLQNGSNAADKEEITENETDVTDPQKTDSEDDKKQKKAKKTREKRKTFFELIKDFFEDENE